MASALEIAVGDRLRLGATHWEKQLFNGTVVTVKDLEVTRGAGTGPGGGGPGSGEPGDESEVEPSALIAASTDDGPRVRFRRDEIRDWYGNIRLDHGYALTIAAAHPVSDAGRGYNLGGRRPFRRHLGHGTGDGSGMDWGCELSVGAVHGRRFVAKYAGCGLIRLVYWTG